MDFNNNGEFDLEDLILTEIILEEDEKDDDKKGGGNKPSGGGCLTSFLFIIGTPIIVFAALIMHIC